MTDVLLDSLIFNALTSIEKTAYIKKMPNGKYRVFSEKGKNMGTYTTKEKAEKRLRQIEFFKKQASVSESTYSHMMRELNKKDKDKAEIFRGVFKKNFDYCYVNDEDNIEEKALELSLQELDEKFNKYASVIQMGDPEYAGRYLAEVVKFLMRKISPVNRGKSLFNLRNKLLNLNELELSVKKMPASSAIGQSITLIKHLLIGHSPGYIRAVINQIARNLV